MSPRLIVFLNSRLEWMPYRFAWYRQSGRLVIWYVGYALIALVISMLAFACPILIWAYLSSSFPGHFWMIGLFVLWDCIMQYSWMKHRAFMDREALEMYGGRLSRSRFVQRGIMYLREQLWGALARWFAGYALVSCGKLGLIAVYGWAVMASWGHPAYAWAAWVLAAIPLAILPIWLIWSHISTVRAYCALGRVPTTGSGSP